MDKITVFQLIGSLGDGGAETLVKDYALLLDKNKFRVKVITLFSPDFTTANMRSLRDNNIEIISLFNGGGLFLRIIYKLFGRYILPGRLLSIIKRESPHVIHVHLANLYIIEGIAKKIHNIKLFYTCHSLPEKFIGPQKVSENRAARYLIDNNDLQMVALHDDMRKEINELFNIDNTIVLNNGVDFEKYKCLSSEEEGLLREEIGIPNNKYVVGHIGRFSPVKNHYFILDVFCEVKKRKPNAVLLLIGNGPLEEDIKQRVINLGIKDSVVILHHRTDVNKLLFLMNVLLFPSLFEGLSMVLIEAQVAGLKCVASNNINQSAILSSKTITLDLSLSPEKWADALLDEKLVNTSYGDISKFNLRDEIKKVELLYER